MTSYYISRYDYEMFSEKLDCPIVMCTYTNGRVEREGEDNFSQFRCGALFHLVV